MFITEQCTSVYTTIAGILALWKIVQFLHGTHIWIPESIQIIGRSCWSGNMA